MRNIVDVPPIIPYNKQRTANITNINATIIVIMEECVKTDRNPIYTPFLNTHTLYHENHIKPNNLLYCFMPCFLGKFVIQSLPIRA